jgi:2-polyprenyl-3-methyl-5-hydroxy-6-metoxy-1,4-benzoquinol methylase
VLEIGPGMGECVSYLNGLGIENIDIVDNSKDVVEQINSKYRINKSFKSLSECLKSVKKGSYDLIVMIQVLEHIKVEKHGEIIKGLFSKLKKGGTVLIVVPNANNPLGLVERYGDLQHFISFTTQSLKDLIYNSEINNFEFDISGYNIPPNSIVNMLRVLLQKLLHLFILAILIVNGGVYFTPLTPNLTLHLKKNE